MSTPTEPCDRTARFHRLRSISFIDGFLDGMELDLSSGSNCLIGGRGTGNPALRDHQP